MSLPHSASDALFPATIWPLSANAPPVRRFTVDQYHRMIETGILGENDRVELIDGWIIDMSPIGPPHATCVALILAALRDRLPPGWILRAQDPITLDSSEPEPDIAVVRGAVRDYRDHHPGGADIGLVIEVADASLQFDRDQKRGQYATAGIPEYWIVNLNSRCLEVYRSPVGGDYKVPEILGVDSTVELNVAEQSFGKFTVADFLP